MNGSSQPNKTMSISEAVGLILLFLTVGVWGAAVISMALMAAIQHLDGLIGIYLMEAGADRIMRRCLMALAAFFIAILLKRNGWQGWKDCGFLPADRLASSRPWHGNALLGISAGLITMGVFSVLTLVLGERIITPFNDNKAALERAVSFIGAGIVVAFIEESVCRGMLFRVLARAWNIRWVALWTSVLFALAHFLSPDPQAFQGSSFAHTSFNIFLSTYTSTDLTLTNLLIFSNLTLLGILFCGLVVKTGTIWLSIGLHAAWIWVIKFFHLWTAVAPNPATSLWLGQRSDFMDSILVAMLLIWFNGCWMFSRWSRVERAIDCQNLKWHIAPGEGAGLVAWLNQYCQNGQLQEGKILKHDEGGRVVAQAQLVLKIYWPKQGWAGIRFLIRPSRARRACQLGRRLRALGMPTPPMLAWAIRRRCGLLRAEYLITREVVDSEQLTSWLERNSPDGLARAKVMAAYGRLVAMFHQNGYSNRDLKHENVMCSISEPWVLQVVDLDGVRRRPWILRRRAQRDLLRVGKSLASLGWSGAADIRAFFDAYNSSVPLRLRRQSFPS